MDQKRGLGRGIASLIPVRPPIVSNVESLAGEGSISGAVSVTVKDVSEPKIFLKIPLQQIQANPQQPRKFFDEQKIEELAQSIRENGLLQPILVTRRGDKYEIVSGERRYRAALKAGILEMPAVIRDTDAKEVLELAIVENIQREDLDAIEEAAAYQELVDQFGYTQEKIAQKVGKDRATIANRMRLLKLPLKIRQALQTGGITEGHARTLLSVPEIEKQLYFLDSILKEGWSVRELETRIQSKRMLLIHGKHRKTTNLAPALVSILDDLRRRLGTQVRLVPSGKKGKIIIEYYSEDDLDRLYQTFMKN